MAMYMRMVRCSRPFRDLGLNNMFLFIQQSHDACPNAPHSLREGPWDQPKLRTWMRFAPRLHFLLPDNDFLLRWSENDNWQDHHTVAHGTITKDIATLARRIKQCLSAEVRRFNHPGPGRVDTLQIVNTGIAWITSEVVQDWYIQASAATQRAFSVWVVSVSEFLIAGLKKSGGLITLAYLVCH